MKTILNYDLPKDENYYKMAVLFPLKIVLCTKLRRRNVLEYNPFM
jgi:hypothetical protein